MDIRTEKRDSFTISGYLIETLSTEFQYLSSPQRAYQQPCKWE